MCEIILERDRVECVVRALLEMLEDTNYIEFKFRLSAQEIEIIPLTGATRIVLIK